MWPMGHAAIAYLCWAGYERNGVEAPPNDVATIAVILGALVPDLIDKPLAWQFSILPTGRSLAHSLLVLVPIVLVVAVLAKRRGRPGWGVAFGIGAISHPLVDAAPALWRDDGSVAFLLYPLTSIEPYGEEGPPSFWALFTDSMGDPYFLLEFLLLGIAVAVWYRRGMPGLAAIRTIVIRTG